MNLKLILCSGSPRRLEILQQMGFNPQVIQSEFIENVNKIGKSPIEYVEMTSFGKLQWVKDNFTLSKSLLISADTIVVCNGEIYEKPLTKEVNLSMLNKFFEIGQVQVITSVNIFNTETNEHQHFTETTICHMAKWLTQNDLNTYVSSLEGLQVAGGFKIQGMGSFLFSKIDGDFYNVVGLPFSGTYRLLKQYKQV